MVKIADLGYGQLKTCVLVLLLTICSDIHSPMIYQGYSNAPNEYPEVIVGSEWSTGANVWSVASLVSFLIARVTL